MLIGLAIWLAVGAFFGVFRARARYRRRYKHLVHTRPKADGKQLARFRRDAFIGATLELMKWSALGIFSGISFVAWIILNLLIVAMEEEIKKNKKGKGATLEAIVLSLLIFVLGAIALDKQASSSEEAETERKLDREDAKRRILPNSPINEEERLEWAEQDRRYEIARAKLLTKQKRRSKVPIPPDPKFGKNVYDRLEREANMNEREFDRTQALAENSTAQKNTE